MTRNQFEKIISNIGNEEETRKENERRLVLKKTRFIAAIILIFVTGAVLMKGFITEKPSIVNSELSGSHSENTSVNSENTYSLPDTTSAASEKSEYLPEETSNPTESSEPEKKPEWFSVETITVKKLSYQSENKEILSFGSASIGANFISTTVFGEHKDCANVYYNTKTGEIVCLYHGFLKASGIELGDDVMLHFFKDGACDNRVGVKISTKDYGHTVGIWIYDFLVGEAFSVKLPDDCESYEDTEIYNNSLWNGKLCVSVNTSQGKHFLTVYSIDTGEYETVQITCGDQPVTGAFIADNVLKILKNNDYSFYNLETGIIANMIGEDVYCSGGKVFSIKNNDGGSFHSNVRVACYDILTGVEIEDQNVIVRTIADNMRKCLLIKNTTSGDEEIMLYDYDCLFYSSDYQYFYAYSSKSGKILCCFTEDGTWFTTDVGKVATGTEIKEGKTYEVINKYAIAAGESNDEILLYYTRLFEEREEIPDYADEKVDSPYWDDYREIKAMNFPESDCFHVSHDEKSLAESIFYACKNMELFRDVTITALENRTNKIKKIFDNYDSMTLGLYINTFRLFFFKENDNYYMFISYNKSHASTQDVYVISEEVYNDIATRIKENTY